MGGIADRERGVLYCGDGDISSAAGYLGGMMTSWGWRFEHVPDDRDLDPDRLGDNVQLLIFSDYPARRLNPECELAIERIVRGGAGLLMIGGWTSFRGRDGFWDGTPVGDLLPVEISAADDRVNCDQATAVRCMQPHPATYGLPWASRPPAIGGFNRVKARADATVLLECQQFEVQLENGRFAFTESRSDVLLAVGRHGAGRTAAFTTDVAPHWVGPLIDWGDGRSSQQTPGAPAREVGDLYVKFMYQLLSWVGTPDPPTPGSSQVY